MIFQFIPRSLRFYEDLKMKRAVHPNEFANSKVPYPIIRFALEAPRRTIVALIYPIGSCTSSLPARLPRMGRPLADPVLYVTSRQPWRIGLSVGVEIAKSKPIPTSVSRYLGMASMVLRKEKGYFRTVKKIGAPPCDQQRRTVTKKTNAL
jgi:hypothetical protein